MVLQTDLPHKLIILPYLQVWQKSSTDHKEKLPPWFENFVEQGDSVGLVWHPVEAGEGGHLRELVSNIMKLENLFSNIKELLQI